MLDKLPIVADVFLSYAREDRDAAALLAKELTTSGWQVWWDRHILPGRWFRRSIAKELASAKCVLVLWSHRSVESDWVCDEADEAKNRDVLIPVLLESVAAPHGFRGLQAVSIEGWRGESGHVGVELVKRSIEHYAPPAVAKQKHTVFISYRRGDGEDAARRLRDDLQEKYGAQAVFMDIDAIPLGVDYLEFVEHSIRTCSVAVVVIGPQWSSVRDRRGELRLFTPDDPVATAIRIALKLNLPAIPVLVQNAELPRANELPESLRPLVQRNAVYLDSQTWRDDVMRLTAQLDRMVVSDR